MSAERKMSRTSNLAAIWEGCSAINGTSLSKGERTDNAPLEGVLLHLIRQYLGLEVDKGDERLGQVNAPVLADRS